MLPRLPIVDAGGRSAAYSIKQSVGSSPSRPCSTSVRMIESGSLGGVPIASSVDSARFPDARRIASNTSASTTPSSSTIVHVGLAPRMASASAGNGNRVASWCGITSLSWKIWMRASSSGSSCTMRRAVLNAMRACRSLTPATIGTSAPSGPSTSAHSPSAAAKVLLPLPLGIATTAVLIPGARTARTISLCHFRSRRRLLAPFPFGTCSPSMNRTARVARRRPSWLRSRGGARTSGRGPPLRWRTWRAVLVTVSYAPALPRGPRASARLRPLAARCSWGLSRSRLSAPGMACKGWS